ncbi:MAG TPA: hypothetical protein VF519_16025 [Mycobacteriales bacterium]|jgi:hypothetical protein
MRLVLALTMAAAAVATFAPAASATCMPLYDYGVIYSYTCSPPGGPATTTTCNRITGHCWSTTSGGGGEGGQ